MKYGCVIIKERAAFQGNARRYKSIIRIKYSTACCVSFTVKEMLEIGFVAQHMLVDFEYMFLAETFTGFTIGNSLRYRCLNRCYLMVWFPISSTITALTSSFIPSFDKMLCNCLHLCCTQGACTNSEMPSLNQPA